MVKRKTALKIRRVHRYLGVFLGLQFLMWTISGMYFSWTDIHEIHGDRFIQDAVQKPAFTDLISPSELQMAIPIKSLVLREIAGTPFYWINDGQLFNARTGQAKNEISEMDALQIAGRNMLPEFKVSNIERIEQVDRHSEYR